ncbi:hypothetical protein RclHR1_00620027 [Rhizophagus clarus]|uniref:Kinase-like domain-containing protein n=1 Tax=Rhizophagus clarus TaxID=94130 RepID=A0A2Z6SHR7_9GLOM|nr:hypothetical protein RclHR1_00620027 [Rhizophagus clarus]GES99878.1 kinase-like domain-containing protein [Rhizophagus clarus]
MSFGDCQGCQQPKTSYDWCKSCNYKHFKNDSKNWTSKNEIIDELIKKVQLNSSSYQEIIEWIPEDRLIIQQCIGKSRFGTVYKAIWKDGYIGYWDYDENCWKRYEKNCIVAVKILNNSENIQSDLLYQIFSVQNHNISGLIRYYGITQDSTTKNYAIISQYLETNVQNYLNKSKLSPNLLWLEKLEILMDVSSTLLQLHNSGLLHENLHTNNILCNMDNKIILSDLGLTHPPNKQNPKHEKKIPGYTNSYGLLNFIPPEIINGKNYTKESDIYCFGIILWEIASQRIFFDQDKKRNLPIIIKKPQLFKNHPRYPGFPYNLELLISKCWNHDPEKRPTIKTIHKQLREWWIGSWNKNMNDIITPFLNYQIIAINVKEFDPIYIHHTLEISNDENEDQSIPKHFKSILSNQQNLNPIKNLSLSSSQSSYSSNVISTLSNSTNTEETYQSPLTNTNLDTNVDTITNTIIDANIDVNIDANVSANIDTKNIGTNLDANIDSNIGANISENISENIVTNIVTNADSDINMDLKTNLHTNTFTNTTLTNTDVIDMEQSSKNGLLNLDKEMKFMKLFEALSNQSMSNDTSIMPGTFPKTEPYYYSKENIFTQSDIIFYDAYLKELVREMHHYWIVNNLSSLLLKNWKMIMRITFFCILAFIHLIIYLFLLNRITYFVIGYNMFNEEFMKKKIGI